MTNQFLLLLFVSICKKVSALFEGVRYSHNATLFVSFYHFLWNWCIHLLGQCVSRFMPSHVGHWESWKKKKWFKNDLQTHFVAHCSSTIGVWTGTWPQSIQRLAQFRLDFKHRLCLWDRWTTRYFLNLIELISKGEYIIRGRRPIIVFVHSKNGKAVSFNRCYSFDV